MRCSKIFCSATKTSCSPYRFTRGWITRKKYQDDVSKKLEEAAKKPPKKAPAPPPPAQRKLVHQDSGKATEVGPVRSGEGVGRFGKGVEKEVGVCGGRESAEDQV